MRKFIVFGSGLLCRVGGKADGDIIMTEEEVIERTASYDRNPNSYDIYELKEVKAVKNGWRLE
jgi:hypothetical protein